MNNQNNNEFLDDDINYSNEFGNHLGVVSKQSGIAFIGKAIGFVLGFLSNFILARYYGPTIIGQYALVNATVSTISIFTIFGFNNGLVKYISRFRIKKQTKDLLEIIKIAFTYGILFSFIGAILMFSLRKYISLNIFKDLGLMNAFLYGSWLIVNLTLYKLFSGLYRGFKQLKYPIISGEIIKKTFFIISILLVAMFGYKSITNVILSLLFSEFLIIIYLIAKVPALGINIKSVLFQPISKEPKNIKRKKEFIAYSSTIILISFMNIILHRIDKIMLGIYMSSDMVGIYNIAVTVASVLLFILTSSNMIFSPIISELFSTHKMNMLNDLYSTITKWIIILTLPVFVSFVIFSETILQVFGEAYIFGSGALIVLSIGQMINAFVGANAYILNMCGYEKLVLLDNILMAMINVLLNAILIPKYGIIGAAIATGFSIAIINILRLFQVNRLLGIFPYNKKYYSIIINLIIVTISTLLMNYFYNNIIAIIIITFLNVIISISISYKFSNNNEKMIFDKFKQKIVLVFKI